MSWNIKGAYVETCSCELMCPCNLSLDHGATYDYCRVTLVFDVREGEIEGTDVSGLCVAAIADTPKVMTEGNWRLGVFVDDRATDEQQAELLKLFTGQLGGPIADLAGLIGEVVAVERSPITFTVDGGKGRLMIGKLVEAEMAPFVGATGNPTTLAETVFTTIPGSPVYASKASQFTKDGSPHGIPSVELKDHNALQGHFRFAA